MSGDWYYEQTRVFVGVWSQAYEVKNRLRL